MAPSYTFRAGAGAAGDITRPDNTVVESGIMNASKPPLFYGDPVKLVSGNFEAIEAGDAATVFAGIVTRVAPSIAGSTGQGFGPGVPNTAEPLGVMKTGYVNVTCLTGTPVKGGIVYMRVQTTGNGGRIGGFDATSDTTNSVAITRAVWAASGKDANNVAEISFL